MRLFCRLPLLVHTDLETESTLATSEHNNSNLERQSVAAT